jgi:hypothetical protein
MAGLEGVLPGTFLLGVFGSGFGNEQAHPALEHESGKIKIIAFLFAESMASCALFIRGCFDFCWVGIRV